MGAGGEGSAVGAGGEGSAVGACGAASVAGEAAVVAWGPAPLCETMNLQHV